MLDYIIFILGTVFSCFIVTFILFQYLNERYGKPYLKWWLFLLLQLGVNVTMVLINLCSNPALNLVSWIGIFSLLSILFYGNHEKKIGRKIVEVTLLFLLLSICESLGYVILEVIIWRFQITFIPPLVLEGLKITFSKLSLLVLYYLFIARVWKPGRQIRLTSAQYIVYCLIIFYSILNVALIFVSVSNMEHMDFIEVTLLLINMFVVVFADLFFLYFTKFTEENGQLKAKLYLLEQQAQLQHEYYASQEEKYNETLAILHDTGRHLNMIEEIYEAKQADEAREYTQQIRTILQPLVPPQYINNPILNILLDDKKRCAASYNIEFQLDIGQADLSFMEPLEVTTVFGNLLDNAIEACQQADGNRSITVRINSYNDFIAIHIINSHRQDQSTTWHSGRPLSTKGKNHGIGLINVENIVKKYNGSLLLEEKEDSFHCSIILNG